MKKFYALAVVLLFAIGSASAQDFYWIGPSNGDWTNISYWSNTSGGAPAGAYPQSLTDNVILDGNASIRINTSVDINRLAVTGTGTIVSIIGTGGGGDANQKNIVVHSTSSVTPALSIGAGCHLENGSISGTFFRFGFGDNTKAAISGEWLFTGDIESDSYAYFELPAASGQTTAITINNGGSMTIGENTVTSLTDPTGDNYLIFAAGSTLNLLSLQPFVPAANYNTASVINITGVTNAGVVIEETGSVGTINYNCPAQSESASLNMIALTVKGNLNILNTNNKELVLIDNITPSLTSKQATINGNLNVQGNSSVSVASNTVDVEPTNTLTVIGNLVANGTAFNIHTGPHISDKYTKLAVGGDLLHTAGSFGSSSTVINQTTDLYIIELRGGSGNQNISSVTGTFDNAGRQVTLRMNNAAGATLLTSLQVGRIDFNSPNKGVLTTGANTLTINNLTPNSTASIVVNSPSADGYVNGTVRRRTQSTEPFVIPTGGTEGYRGVTLIPSTNALTLFESKYFNTAYSNLSVLSPLEGVSPDYYWIIDRISGTADAAVQLSIPGAVTGAQSNYGLTVARFNGSDWSNEKGTTGISVAPGTSTSGTIRSQVQTAFSPFTIGYALNSALPTLLVSFNGKKAAKETIDLKWKITDNSTPEVFEVTRSADGVNFEKIGSVAGIENVRTYEYTDRAILAGNNYYRLRMLDRDGAITYSTIVVISNGTKGTFLNSVTPSVVQNRTRLNIQSSANANMQLVVTDMNGRIVQRQNVSVSNGSQDYWLDVSAFSSGAFQVTGFVNGVKTATLRFIKL